MEIQEQPRRLDWLAIAWLVLLLGLLAVGTFGIAQIAMGVSNSPVRFDVPLAQVDEAAGLNRLPPGVVVDVPAWVAVRVDDPTPTQSLLNSLTRVPTTVVVVAMLVVLLRVVGNARRKDPFSSRNVRLLRILGATVLAGGALADIVEELAGRALADPVAGGPAGGFVWSGWWLIGLAFLAIAEVVNRGVAMRTELESVV